MFTPFRALVFAAPLFTLTAAQPPSFFTPLRDVPTLAEGASMLTADFNGDGIPDLVFRDSAHARVTVFFGNGDGTFHPGPFLSTPGDRNAAPIAAVDVNGDGKPDIVLSSKAIDVFLSNGDGTFGGLISTPSAPGAASLLVADFNRDGKPDIVTGASAQFNALSIQLGLGNGSFAAPTPIAFETGVTVSALGSADFNGDGKPDLAVSATQGSQSTLFLLAGGGDGSFGTAAVLGAGSTFAIADFNGDGRPDLVLATPSQTVALLLNNGDGTFTTSTLRFPLQFHSIGRLASADIDGDGLPDIIASGGGNQEPLGYSIDNYRIALLLNRGGGSFAPLLGPTVRAGVLQIVVADFNRDGRLDIATTSGFPSILFGNGDGSFRTPVSLNQHPDDNGAIAIAVADFNSDGLTDIVSTAYYSGSVALRLGSGGPSFAPPAYFRSVSLPLGLLVGDFNGDGKPDVLTWSFYSVAVLLSDGAGSFGPPRLFDLPDHTYRVVAADFDEDEKLDIAFVGVSSGVFVVPGDGTGGFSTPRLLGGKSLGALAAADLTGSGHTDIVALGSGGGRIVVWRNQGKGVFAPPASTPYSAGGFLTLADVNGDRVPDLISSGADRMFVGLGNGDGTFQAARSIDGFFAKSPPQVADLNGDGIPDLFAPDYLGSAVVVAPGNGDGTFGRALRFATGPAPSDAASAVLKAGQLPSILTLSFVSDIVSLLINTTR